MRWKESIMPDYLTAYARHDHPMYEPPVSPDQRYIVRIVLRNDWALQGIERWYRSGSPAWGCGPCVPLAMTLEQAEELYSQYEAAAQHIEILPAEEAWAALEDEYIEM
jgi:hypothetical protein